MEEEVTSDSQIKAWGSWFGTQLNASQRSCTARVVRVSSLVISTNGVFQIAGILNNMAVAITNLHRAFHNSHNQHNHCISCHLK
jgi:hypothetical protein